MSDGTRAEMFDIVSNDHESTQNYEFFVLDRKYFFWANLVQKIKTICYYRVTYVMLLSSC